MLVEGYIKLTRIRQQFPDKSLEKVYEIFYATSDISDKEFIKFFLKRFK